MIQIPPARFLEGLAPHDLRTVVQSAELKRYLSGELIYSQGNDAVELFLLIRGRARFFFTTSAGRRILLLWQVPGDVLGGRSLLQESSTYLMSAEALRESQILVWKRSTIRDLANRYPRLMDNGLSLASEWAEWYVATHVAVISETARQRVAGVLTALAQTVGHQGPGGIVLDATNEELASAAYVTPFTVSRLLSEWQRAGILTKRRGKIALAFVERLLGSAP
jgi:CRP/FNR family transcriptional regulator, nitrogen oxide reductase regulator